MFLILPPSSVRNLRWICAAAGVLLSLLVAQPPVGAADTNAGPGYIVRVFETENGLPQNSVMSMVQTRDGYLWLGTLGGLVRFDGARFSTVLEPNNTPGLNDSHILYLFEDSQRNLWIGTETAGTVIMQAGRVTAPTQLAALRLRAASEDAAGAVWLCFENGELWRYAQGQFSHFTLPSPDENNCRTVMQETNGPLWVATPRSQFAVGAITGNTTVLPVAQTLGARRLDALVASPRGGYWRLADTNVARWSGGPLARDVAAYPWSFKLGALEGFWEITSACEDHDGNLVVGTKAGVFWVSPAGEVTSLSTNGVYSISSTGEKTLRPAAERLSHNWVSSLVVDREGTLWVGTDGGGLNRVKRQSFQVLESVQNWIVQSVTEDADGGVWIASKRDGLGYWSKGTFQQGFAGETIQSVFADREGRVWFSRARGGELIQFQKGRSERVGSDGVIQQTVRAMHQDRAGRMWFGMPGGLARFETNEWKLFTTQDGLSSANITSIADDAEGNVWFGTQRGGINRWRDGKFTALRKTDGAPSDDITALLADEQGVLWAATFGNGLGRFQNGKWTRYTKREGLASDKLCYLLEDGDGNLWIGSQAGVLRVPKKALTDLANGLTRPVPCRAYEREDGLVTRECTAESQPAAWRGRDGTLWFSTMKGAAALKPAWLRPNTNPPPVAIESVSIDDLPRANNLLGGMPTNFVLHPGEERLEIQYSSLNLGAPDRARFRYRLVGYEKNWNEVGNNVPASYRKLDPGHYTFHVLAANEDGVWNESGSSLAILVLTPYWKTWWFSSVMALCVFGLIAGIVRYLSTQKLLRQVAVLKQKETLEKERARIARDIHDQVGASLTQVALLGELVETDKDLPGEVEAHARQISQTARETTRALDEIVWTVNPQNDTLEGLVNYICKYTQDYLAVAGVRYRFDLPTQLPAKTIAPDVRHNVFLASKEAVTNIVRHAQATEARIRLRLEAASFTLEIEDNGRGVAALDQEAAMRRNGLKNMRKRMEDIGGSFSIKPGSDGGALVCFVVPFADNNGAGVKGEPRD